MRVHFRLSLTIESLNHKEMKTNMGLTDRIIRSILAAVIVVLYFANVISGTLCIVLLVVAGVFFLTSFVSTCPLYSLFGLSTCATKKAHR